MAHFVVHYKGTDGKQYPEYYTSQSATAAREAFRKEYADPILNVENITLQDMAHNVAHHLLGLLKNSTKRNEKMIGMLSKPISAISITLIQEYSHYLHHEHNNNARTIAKKIYTLL